MEILMQMPFACGAQEVPVLMKDHVHVNLVFSRSGQKLSVQLPRDVAQSANSLSDAQVALLIEKAQQIQMSSYRELAYPL
jgi:hypothetical protein